MPWYDAEDRSEADERVAHEIAARKQRGEPMVPLPCEVDRGAPCSTFWGKAWCDNLEASRQSSSTRIFRIGPHPSGSPALAGGECDS